MQKESGLFLKLHGLSTDARPIGEFMGFSTSESDIRLFEKAKAGQNKVLTEKIISACTKVRQNEVNIFANTELCSPPLIS